MHVLIRLIVLDAACIEHVSGSVLCDVIVLHRSGYSGAITTSWRTCKTAVARIRKTCLIVHTLTHKIQK